VVLALRIFSGIETRRMHVRHDRELRARVAFLTGWRVFLSRRTETGFQAWRDQRDRTARKYAMWERGEKLLSRQPSSMMRCPCGEVTAMTRPEAIPIANTSTPSTKPVKHTEARPFTDPGTIRLPLGVDVQDDPRDLAPVGAFGIGIGIKHALIVDHVFLVVPRERWIGRAHDRRHQGRGAVSTLKGIAGQR
jgi:hypothetical protein